jgi:hypothetical protein
MRFNEKQRNIAIDISSSGDNIVIAAPSYGYIAIDHIDFIPTSAVGVKFITGTTEQSGTYPLDAKQALTIENPSIWQDGIINCNPGEAFIINLDGAVQVSGLVRYRIVGN